ncbi:hypothetical protein DL762_006398 [Monosporascus cannonballus]|uniref:Uncharacterized protein n=1 Tax=Monosporascus cannonballus TaxID=155416 RepID=A0ABY0H258_9PEZI|nr:hypothetical protein DL762_006398 [Monosporascus cannonballus]RYO86473.1 hypothetical protein DL763_006683 [Monosporascus cannonballus]
MCGGRECPVTRLTDRDGTSEQNKVKRGDPDEGDWSDPSDYSDPKHFVAIEAWWAYNGDIISTENSVIRFPEEQDPDLKMTTSEIIQFKNQVASLSIQGLYGCTSVIVVSQREAWASHIWEPTFTDEGDRFENKAIKFILTGLAASDPQYHQHKYGLVQMRWNNKLPEIGTIFGGDGSEIPGTHVYIFVPRLRIDIWELKDNYGNLLNYTDRNGNYLDDEVRQAEDANAGAGFKFSKYVNRIKEAVLRVVGTEVPVEVIEYLPNVLSVADAKKRLSRREIATKLGDNDQKQSRGKLFLQYQPGKCDRPALWRLWVETQLDIAGRYAEWDPSPDQIFQGQGNPDLNDVGSAKRADACIVSTPSSIPTKTEENPTDSTRGTTTTDDPTGSTGGVTTTDNPTGSTEGTTTTDGPRIDDGDVCDEIKCSKKVCPDGSTAGCQPVLRLPGSLGITKFCGCPTSARETPEATVTPELPPPPPYETGTCNLHIHEWSEYYT